MDQLRKWNMKFCESGTWCIFPWSMMPGQWSQVLCTWVGLTTYFGSWKIQYVCVKRQYLKNSRSEPPIPWPPGRCWSATQAKSRPDPCLIGNWQTSVTVFELREIITGHQFGVVSIVAEACCRWSLCGQKSELVEKRVSEFREEDIVQIAHDYEFSGFLRQ